MPSTRAVVAAVALGGGIGATARYGIAVAFPAALPWSTIAVNTLGCAAIGVLMVLTESRAHPLTRPFLGTGFLGGFTTFSTYALDAHDLLTTRPALAALYFALTPLLALLAVWAGAAGARRLR
jgi:CrcB protein